MQKSIYYFILITINLLFIENYNPHSDQNNIEHSSRFSIKEEK